MKKDHQDRPSCSLLEKIKFSLLALLAVAIVIVFAFGPFFMIGYHSSGGDFSEGIWFTVKAFAILLGGGYLVMSIGSVFTGSSGDDENLVVGVIVLIVIVILYLILRAIL